MVKGEENQTQTFLDAAVYDIKSRALLFRAAGTATSGSKSTPVDAAKVMQAEVVAGFDAATDDLILVTGSLYTVADARRALGGS